MGAKRLEELRAWQVARALKLEVYAILKESPQARADVRFRGQLADAAENGESDIAEGFRRFSAGQFTQFLDYALGSIEEAIRRLQDGIDREYFVEERCRAAFELGQKALATTLALKNSLRPFTRRHKREKGRKRRRRTSGRDREAGPDGRTER